MFRHLSTTNGLSYIGVNDMVVDRKGNLWIATGNGLNMFNGKKVDKYFATDFPQMQNSNVIHVTCDSSNRVWVLTEGGNVTVLDQRRQMHRIALYDKNTFVRTRWILNSQNGNIILLTEKGHYFFNPKISFDKKDSITNAGFTFAGIKGFDSLVDKRHRQVFYYDDDNYLLVNDDGFFKINYRARLVEKKYPVTDCNALVKWGENGLLYYDRVAKEIKSVDFGNGAISTPLKALRDQLGKPITAAVNFAEKIGPGRFIFTTTNAGIYIYDASAGKIFNYRHHIADPNTILGNSQTTVAAGYKGWVFINCNPNGISYFNSSDFTGNQNVFLDDRGNGYDGHIAGIASLDNNTYFIGTGTGMLKWERNSNTTQFLDYSDSKGQSIFRGQEVTSIVFDNQGKVWATTADNGLIVLDQSGKLLKHLKNEEGNLQSIKIKRFSRVLLGKDGYIWVCGRNGVCRVNSKTYVVDNFQNTPLTFFDPGLVAPVYFIDSNNVIIAASQKGLFQYNIKSQQLKEIAAFAPYKAEGFFDIGSDHNGNIYVANRKGLKIIYPNGRMKHLTTKDGLVIDRSESVIRDKRNRIWIGNDIGLACYNPGDSSLRVFDERYGLSIYGFRVGSYFQMPNGEFFFGTPKGMQYFHPDSLFSRNISLNVSVTKLESKRLASTITGNSSFDLAASDNYVTFHFGTVDYSPHLRTYFEYKLVDLDKDWIKVADQNSVRYTSLPPGKYVFKVRVSNDNKNWQEADNEVTINVALPFYEAVWFKLVAALIALGSVLLVIMVNRRRQQKNTAELETELLITRFASQINRHKNVNELLWDITKNCISRLHFEDCVIYLKNENNVLIQQAAYGPKSPVDLTIHQPIEIPVGKGIVGSVAATGKPELVNDTEKDPRYIVDDIRRHAELAVPVIIDGQVQGVIDSEHPEKNFFTDRHLQILSAVAALAASQIQRIRSEEGKQKATIELLENKRKAMESRLQSLRLQMNPHFLFNALNSIQQMILANEEMVATRYLSRFSKLLRSILVHSDKEYVTLKEELEILQLYVELESVRFKDVFEYKIVCEEDIDLEELRIPTLLVQPFVENAIWHGLMHKEGSKKLMIHFYEKKDYLQCVVEDNGVGREKAKESRMANGGQQHTSKGISVSVERLKASPSSNGMGGSLTIIDLKDEQGMPAGTRVEINFPIQN